MFCKRFECIMTEAACKKRRETEKIQTAFKEPLYFRCDGCTQWMEEQDEADIKKLFEQYYSLAKARDRLRFRLADAEEILGRVREIAERETRPFQYQVLMFLKEGIERDRG